MNLRTLAGPLLAFASLAVMLGLIAGLAVYLAWREDARTDDLIVGEYGFRGPAPALNPRPLANSYPFDPYFGVPPDAKEITAASSGPRDEWTGIFLITSAAGVIEDLRRQAEAHGARTTESSGNTSGFIMVSAAIEGAVQVVEGGGRVHLVVSLTRYPKP